MSSHALLDVSTSALLALSPEFSAVSYVEQITPDALAVVFVTQNSSRFYRSLSSNGIIPPFRSPRDPSDRARWRFDRARGLFVPLRIDLFTAALRERAALADARVKAVSNINRMISFARVRITSGAFYQEYVYLVKRDQARQCLEHDADASLSHEWPYVRQYADVSGLPLDQAAREILFKAQLSDEAFARTEHIRLESLSRLRAEHDPTKIQTIVEECKRACWGTSLS